MLAEAYHAVDVFSYDIAYIYSDLRGFASESLLAAGKNEFLSSFMSPLAQKSITAIVPSFTYTTHGRFDTMSTMSNLGALNSFVVNAQDSYRSEHPIFSYAASGPLAHKITHQIGKSAFGSRSVFERLQNHKVCFLHIGRPISAGNTIAHYIEQSCGAIYRYNKVFGTEVYIGNSFVGTGYSAFLRIRNRKDSEYGVDFKRAADKLHSQHMVKQVDLDMPMTDIASYSYNDCLDLWTNEFYRDPCFFLKPGTHIENLNL